MRFGALVLFATSVVIIANCGSTAGDDPEMRRKVAAVEMFEKAPAGREFSMMQEVKVTECSVDDGKTQLKVEAAKIGADAVISYVCVEKGLKCGLSVKTYQCSGDAVKWKS